MSLSPLFLLLLLVNANILGLPYPYLTDSGAPLSLSHISQKPYNCQRPASGLRDHLTEDRQADSQPSPRHTPALELRFRGMAVNEPLMNAIASPAPAPTCSSLICHSGDEKSLAVKLNTKL
ncbi:hypothetical protein EOD39_18050 [Acipenser ruthenus]|uniref:Uncharacterized protein n=1 Tax=Acipenser ruthenus TaxID=7906 RepID=A0A444V1W9_ACIRT|nr:hypothetical protein EOD39_18050 [Acipenser ruthenus]